MSQSNHNKLVLGYWALRGKAHIIRLLMEHLKIPYEDVIYTTPQSWYQDSFSKQNTQLELPYLIDKDFIIDESVPILNYILKKYDHQIFLGLSIQDQAQIDMYLWSMQSVFKNLIGISLQNLDSIEEVVQLKQNYWKRIFKPKLESIQKMLKPDSWFLGYLTVVDFDLHEVVSYIKIIFPSKIGMFPKIQRIEKKISQLPAIRAYLKTQKCQNLCFLPVQMCKKFKSPAKSN